MSSNAIDVNNKAGYLSLQLVYFEGAKAIIASICSILSFFKWLKDLRTLYICFEI